MADFSGGLNNLLQNKMFLQYLSAAGGAISEGKPLGAALNQVTQQNIASQNQLGILKKMLGQYPAGTKMTVDDKGSTFKIPHQIQEETLTESSPEGTGLSQSNTPVSQPNQLVPQPQQNQILSQMLSGNPLDDINMSDLAGLSPTDISNALQLKLGVGNQQLNAMEMVQKLTPQPVEMAPVDLPGYGPLTLDQYKALDSKTKGYAYYVYDAKSRGEKVMSQNEWAQQTADPVQLQYYEASLKDPGFKKYLLEMARANATNINIGEKVEAAKQTAEAVGRVKQELELTSPDLYTKTEKEFSNDSMSYNMPSEDFATKYKAKHPEATDDEILSVWRDANIKERIKQKVLKLWPKAKYVDGEGWYVNGELKVGM